MTARASYRRGVEWIAWNDEPTMLDPQFIAEQLSTQLLADLFRKEPEEVAAAVVRYRKRNPDV